MAGDYELLTTKLTPPRPPTTLVAREALAVHLDKGLERRLTLVSAPAGFGKTTLVGAWLTRHRRGPGTLVGAWLSLDSGDNDPVRFWRYVATACRAFGPEVGQETLALLNRPRQVSFEAALTALINGVAALDGRHLLVVDDYHLVTADEVHETLSFLIDHLPANLHLVLLTRSDPPLPLARLRARDELTELRATELRFSLDETRAFLQEAIPFPLSSNAVAAIFAQTEGWAAGLRLVALALQSRSDPADAEQFLTTFSGSHPAVVDYLVAEVLEAQPQSVQAFLLQTAFLPRLTGSLADAVTGRQDSAAQLEALERANLFLLRLDSAGRWYRYHSLFAEAMQDQARRRMDENRLCDLSQRASAWYADHGLLGEAVDAALFAHDFERAADLLERIVAPRLVSNEFHTLRAWMAQIPAERLGNHPELCLAYAEAILFTSDRRTAADRDLLEVPLGMAEARWRAAEEWARVGQVLALRALIAWWYGDRDQVAAIAYEALDLLPEQDTEWRGVSLIFIGLGQILSGRLEEALPTLLAARALSDASDNIYSFLSSSHLLADVYAGRGELSQAGQLYRRVLAETEDLDDAELEPREMVFGRGRALLGLGALSLEWNDLDAALTYARQARDLGFEIGEENLLVPASLILARTLRARGQAAQAGDLLLELVARARGRHRGEVLLWQARLALAAGDLGHAAAITGGSLTDEAPEPVQEFQALVSARLYLARGEAGAALALLDPWLDAARIRGRVRSELEILALGSLARYMAGNLPEARDLLTGVLGRAQPEGFRRLFLDEGPAMAGLLRDMLPDLSDSPLSGYVRALLLSFAAESRPPGARHPGAGRDGTGLDAGAALVEPLSKQEERVLRLLASGMTNPEIAAELVISLNTVKTHVRNIYRKLDVHDRAAASDTARQLNLS